MPTAHLRGRTLYSFAAWFRDLTSGLPVHHNVPDAAWRAVLRFCTDGWFLCGAAARWRHGPALSGCPCCGRPPEDELHVALECPAYADLRALHDPLFAHLPADSALAMRLLFCPAHFRPLGRFLRACHARRLEYVSGRRLPVTLEPPEWDPGLGLPMARSLVSPSPALVCWSVVCFLVVSSLVCVLWLSLWSVG